MEPDRKNTVCDGPPYGKLLKKIVLCNVKARRRADASWLMCSGSDIQRKDLMVEQYEQWKASGALAPQKRERWGGLALCLMQWGLLFDIAMFPLGMSLREIGAIWSVACLLAFYLLAWDRSVLRVLPFKWLYLGFMSFILFKIAHSEFPLVSWEGVHHNFYKGFAMLLVGLEYPRRERDVKRLVWAFVIAVLILGLDGVYQAVAGVDLIEGTPLQGGV